MIKIAMMNGFSRQKSEKSGVQAGIPDVRGGTHSLRISDLTTPFPPNLVSRGWPHWGHME